MKETIADAEAKADKPPEPCMLTWLRDEQRKSEKKTLDEANLTIHLANYLYDSPHRLSRVS